MYLYTHWIEIIRYGDLWIWSTGGQYWWKEQWKWGRLMCLQQLASYEYITEDIQFGLIVQLVCQILEICMKQILNTVSLNSLVIHDFSDWIVIY